MNLLARFRYLSILSEALRFSQKEFNLSQWVLANSQAIGWIEWPSVFNHPEGHPHESSGSSNTDTTLRSSTLHQPIGKRGRVGIMSHKGIANTDADVAQVFRSSFRNGVIGRFSR